MFSCVDEVYYRCRARLQLTTLAYTRGECRWELVSQCGTYLVVEIRNLYESGLQHLLNLPQA